MRYSLEFDCGLIASFQRYACPRALHFTTAPTSLGALPLGFGLNRQLLLPLAENECFWIGLETVSASVAVLIAAAAELTGNGTIDVLSGNKWNPEHPTTARIPETLRIPGLRCGDDSFRPLARAVTAWTGSFAPCRQLLLFSAAADDSQVSSKAPVCIRLVDYAIYARETGEPPPDRLDPEAGYKGWRLP